MFDWVLDVPLIPAQIGDATAKSKFRNSLIQRLALREKCGIRSYSGPHSAQMRENSDQNNSEYGLFLRGLVFLFLTI